MVSNQQLAPDSQSTTYPKMQLQATASGILVTVVENACESHSVLIPVELSDSISIMWVNSRPREVMLALLRDRAAKEEELQVAANGKASLVD